MTKGYDTDLAGWVATLGNLRYFYDRPFNSDNSLNSTGKHKIRELVDRSGDGTIQSDEFTKSIVDNLKWLDWEPTGTARDLVNDIAKDTEGLRAYRNVFQRDVGLRIDPLTEPDKELIRSEMKQRGITLNFALLDEMEYSPPGWKPPTKKAEVQFSLA